MLLFCVLLCCAAEEVNNANDWTVPGEPGEQLLMHAIAILLFLLRKRMQHNRMLRLL